MEKNINKQNCDIWCDEQPEDVQELPLHPLKTNNNLLFETTN